MSANIGEAAVWWVLACAAVVIAARLVYWRLRLTVERRERDRLNALAEQRTRSHPT